VVDVKKMIESGYFAGSRLSVAAHLLGSEGGHADNGQFLAGNPAMALITQAPNIGTGTDFFRRAVRNEVKFGSDFIKIFLSGGFATPNDGPEDQQLSDEELECIIQTANGLRIPTTAHVYSPKLIQKLIHYGVSGIEHGAMIDEETISIMEESDTYLVPTMGCYDEIIHGNEENMLKKPPAFQKKLRKYAEQLRKGRELIVNSKIRLGYGSDYVAVFQCYDSWHEYESMMKSGVDTFRILKAATSENARILGLQDKIGSIKIGQLADLAGWHRDLLHDPEAISQCDFVMKEGVVYPSVYSKA
jgi:imidazolonepropionase-like amidohydrolase